MSEASLGKFTFVLHSHLPYVLSHGTWPHGMVWLNEAAAETYIPLWRVFRKLQDEGVKAAVTIGFSPVLAEQLRDSSFALEFEDYLKQRQLAAREDLAAFETLGDETKATTARHWMEFYAGVEEDFNGPLNRDIVSAFRDLQDAGVIEIITCGATHGYLPLLGTDEAVSAQVKLAVDSYKTYFGRQPKGIWLPECAYRPAYHWKSPVDPDDEGFMRRGVEEIVQEHGLRYFIVDTHLLKGGQAVGTYLERFKGLAQLWDQAGGEKARVFEENERLPYRTYFLDSTVGEGKEDPVGFLTRDAKTSLQVWSGEYGYPGDGNYLDFHKKHFPGGHRYWRVTRADADLGDKEEYVVANTEGRLGENAEHFHGLLQETIAAADVPTSERFIVSPFDTELFGHWWYEGPRFLEKVLEHIARGGALTPAHGGELIEEAQNAPVVKLPEGSWGEGGFHYIWLNDETAWSWPLIHAAEKHMTRLAREHKDTDDPKLKTMLQQLGRELLVLEASDWQFLISTIAAADYAEMRLNLHANDFEFIRGLVESYLEGKDIDAQAWEKFATIQQRDALFPNLDISIWA